MAVMSVPFPVPVFAAVGTGAWGPVQELRGRAEVRLVPTPRHASVLLVAGRVPEAHVEALDRVHDQVPHPRVSVRWSSGSKHRTGDVAVDGDADAVVETIVRSHFDLAGGVVRSSPDRLPDEEPNEWRGVGPHGQGGEGMMGGTPYGRPMAMTGDDRDGLALDQLHVRFGPFLEAIPPGVTLRTTVQGDVLQSVEPELAAPSADVDGGPVETSEVTAARAGLRWLAHGLHLHGLDALAARSARLATRVGAGDDVAGEFKRLRRSVVRSGLLWSIGGVGGIDGLGDASDRWRRRLDRIGGAFDGQTAAGDEELHLSWDRLAERLAGQTIADAVTTIVSLHDRLVVPLEVVRE